VSIGIESKTIGTTMSDYKLKQLFYIVTTLAHAKSNPLKHGRISLYSLRDVYNVYTIGIINYWRQEDYDW